MKNGEKSIGLNPINSERLIGMNPNQSENKFSIHINPNISELGLIQTEFSIRINTNESAIGMIQINFDWKFGLDQSELGLIMVENLVSNWFGFIRIVASDLFGLGRIDFLPFFIKRVTKRFSDWLGYRYRNESE